MQKPNQITSSPIQNFLNPRYVDPNTTQSFKDTLGMKNKQTGEKGTTTQTVVLVLEVPLIFIVLWGGRRILTLEDPWVTAGLGFPLTVHRT